MVLEKITQLILRLVEQTEQGKLNWEASAAANAYQVAFPGYAVVVRLDEDPFNKEPEYSLSIINQDGDVVDQAWASDIDSDRNTSGTLSRLYIAARRQAMGIDKALDTILADLPKSAAETRIQDLDDEVPF